MKETGKKISEVSSPCTDCLAVSRRELWGGEALQAAGLGFLSACLIFKERKTRGIGWVGRQGGSERRRGRGNRDQNISYKKETVFNFKRKVIPVHLTEADLCPTRQQTETEKEPWELLTRKTGNVENRETEEEGLKTEPVRSRLDHKGLDRKEPYSSRVIAFEEIHGTACWLCNHPLRVLYRRKLPCLVKCEILANSLTSHCPFIFPTIGRTLLQATILTAL